MKELFSDLFEAVENSPFFNLKYAIVDVAIIFVALSANLQSMH